MGLLYYDLGIGVEAFTTRKGESLPYYVIQPHQIHKDNIAIIKDKNIDRDNLHGIDALITNLVDCPIAVRTADCVPILLYDPQNKVVAAIHSGWRGTVLRITEKVILKMKENYGTIATELYAIIGPSIGPKSFIVKNDVVEYFEKSEFPVQNICKFKQKDTYLINLWKANQWLLEETGVKRGNINIAGICTYIHHNDFYSARYEKNNKCGRNINVISLKGYY